MANKQSNIYNVPLVAELNMDSFNGDIKQFQGFNKNNSPYVGKCLSNLYKKEYDSEGNTVVDTDGNLISYDSGTKYFKKNGQDWLYNTYEDTQVLVRKEAKFWNEYTGADVPNGEVVAAVPYDEENVYDYILWNGEKVYFCYWYEENGEIKHGFKVIQTAYTNTRLNSYCFRFENISIFTYGLNVSAFNGNVEKWSVVQNASAHTGFYPRIFTCISTQTQVYSRTGKRFFYINGHGIIYELDETGTFSYRYDRIAVKSHDHPEGLSNYNCYVSGAQLNQAGYLCNRSDQWFWVDSSTRGRYGNYGAPSTLYPVATPSGGESQYSYGNVVATFYSVSVPFPSWYPTGSGNIRPTFTSLEDVNTSITFEKINYGDYEVKGLEIYPLGIWDRVNATTPLAYSDTNFPKKIKKGPASSKHFSVLYNDNQLSGVSYNGVLLSEWYSLDDLFCIQENHAADKVIYKTTEKKFYIVSVQTITDSNLKVYLYNNKVFTNLVNGTALNIGKGELFRAFRDFNGRLPLITKAFNNPTAPTRNIALGINPNYTDGESDIVSMLPNSITINLVGTPASSNPYIFDSDDVVEGVDLYISASGNPVYDRTFKSATRGDEFINPLKKGLEWVNATDGNIVLSPSLFAEFVSSNLNLDLIKENSDTYRMITYNNKKVFGYYLLSLMENVQDVFVIQGQAYAIVDNLIYAYDVDSGVAITSQPILNIQDLKFLAASPYKAYFYSSLARSVFSFTGSNVLNLEFSTTKIKNIVDSTYNPDTLSVIFTTDKELVFITNFGNFALEKPAGVQNERLYISKKGLAIVYPDVTKTVFVRYSKTIPEDPTEFEKQPLDIETAFYGVSETQVSINDTLYLRLFDEDKEAGEVQVSAETITDVGRKTETTAFKIKSSDWDESTSSLVLRYQPKMQRGLGTSFKIKSPFSIAAMGVSNTIDNKITDSISRSAVIAPEVGTNITEW